ncbi:MAG TPA: hypothetical protein VF784_09795 [Anaerolineales bacterium]
MSTDTDVRWGWLKFMYVYTIVVAGAVGLGIIVYPGIMTSVFGWPVEEPITLGIAGSVFMAFAILSIFGLRAPLKFAPILALQLCYKSIWFVGVVLPLWLTGQFRSNAVFSVVLYATFIVGDLIAIPFPYIFSRQAAQ